MRRKVFFSFHYDADYWRASQVRNMGVIEKNPLATDNDWEAIKRGGDVAIKRWIDAQLSDRTCAAVLIGANTAGRKWITYEIEKAWSAGKGVFGIYVHNLKNKFGLQASKGHNPFDSLRFTDGSPLSSVVSVYDPPCTESTQVYAYISAHLANWVERAVAARTT